MGNKSSYPFSLFSQMEIFIAFFVSGREDFFKEKACINCPINCFCACDDVSNLFDIEEVMKKELVDVGEGVKVSEPIIVKRRLMTGESLFTSLSHKGILAICGYSSGHHYIQLTDLNNDRRVRIYTERHSYAAFYDDMIILAIFYKPLREARVEEVFNNPRIETFKYIEGARPVTSYADVSLSHERRVLYYIFGGTIFTFNVDTRVNTEINIERNVNCIASVTGIDCSVKAVFQNYVDRCIYTLNNDNTVTKVYGKYGYGFELLFPLTSDSRNIEDATFMHGVDLMKSGKDMSIRRLIRGLERHSVVRVYRDIFLGYSCMFGSWILFRLITP